MLHLLAQTLLLVVTGLWLFQTARSAVGVRHLPRLDPDIRPRTATSVSIIIPTRNDASTITDTVECALSQRDVNVQVVVVDDRSQDKAGETLSRLAADDLRLTVRRVETLPQGWLGKTNAMRVGAADADSDWLLFMDADVALAPDAVARAVAAAQRADAAHVCLLPGLHAKGLLARGALAAFFLSVVARLGDLNTDRRGAFFGVGAFNLIQTDVYRSFGGHEPLRMEVVDDVKLGFLVRQAGERSRAILAPDAVHVEWGATIASLVEVVEKNHFAVLGYRTLLTCLLAVILAGAWGGSIAGAALYFATGAPAGLAAFLAMALMGLPGAAISRRLGWGSASGLISPFLLPILIYAAMNSMLVTLRRGGVRWRDTFYPLETLRRERLRPKRRNPSAPNPQ